MLFDRDTSDTGYILLIHWAHFDVCEWNVRSASLMKCETHAIAVVLM